MSTQWQWRSQGIRLFEFVNISNCHVRKWKEVDSKVENGANNQTAGWVLNEKMSVIVPKMDESVTNCKPSVSNNRECQSSTRLESDSEKASTSRMKDGGVRPLSTCKRQKRFCIDKEDLSLNQFNNATYHRQSFHLKMP